MTVAKMALRICADELEAVIADMGERPRVVGCIRRDDLVWFDWKGFRCVSPVIAVNRTTVRVVVSDGERLLPVSRIVEHDPAPRTESR